MKTTIHRESRPSADITRHDETEKGSSTSSGTGGNCFNHNCIVRLLCAMFRVCTALRACLVGFEIHSTVEPELMLCSVSIMCAALRVLAHSYSVDTNILDSQTVHRSSPGRLAGDYAIRQRKGHQGSEAIMAQQKVRRKV